MAMKCISDLSHKPFAVLDGRLVAATLFWACSCLCLACLGYRDEFAVKCIDDASLQTMSCLQRKRQNSVTFFPLWLASAAAKHTWGKYLSVHWQKEFEKCPRSWVCVWVRVLSFLRPAACRRSEVTKPSCSPFRYSLSLRVVLGAAWSKPATFKQISRLSIVLKIQLFMLNLMTPLTRFVEQK